jgi:hypothetical protein
MQNFKHKNYLNYLKFYLNNEEVKILILNIIFKHKENTYASIHIITLENETYPDFLEITNLFRGSLVQKIHKNKYIHLIFVAIPKTMNILNHALKDIYLVYCHPYSHEISFVNHNLKNLDILTENFLKSKRHFIDKDIFRDEKSLLHVPIKKIIFHHMSTEKKTEIITKKFSENMILNKSQINNIYNAIYKGKEKNAISNIQMNVEENKLNFDFQEEQDTFFQINYNLEVTNNHPEARGEVYKLFPFINSLNILDEMFINNEKSNLIFQYEKQVNILKKTFLNNIEKFLYQLLYRNNMYKKSIFFTYVNCDINVHDTIYYKDNAYLVISVNHYFGLRGYSKIATLYDEYNYQFTYAFYENFKENNRFNTPNYNFKNFKNPKIDLLKNKTGMSYTWQMEFIC